MSNESKVHSELESSRTRDFGNVEFFIKELAQVTSENDRRYASISKRLTELESKRRDAGEELFSPNMMTAMMVLMFAPVIIDVISALVVKWKSSSSLPS